MSMAKQDNYKFLSTPSARRATWSDIVQHHEQLISIHALREEGDGEIFEVTNGDFQFLSTPSARRATRVHTNNSFIGKFLSTPSARRATR